MSINAHSSTKDSFKKENGLVGYDRLLRIFKNLADKRELSSGYIFFGEKGIGKFTFASRLADYLEFGSFEFSKTPRSECLIVNSGDEGNIGIDEARSIKYFLSREPVSSGYRTVIVDGADGLTDQAQNAMLKISEESPPHGLIILVLANPDSLIQTLQSRFQKIYFPRLRSSVIEEYIRLAYGADEKIAKDIVSYSFGKMGRAIELASGEMRLKSARKDALEILKSRDSKIMQKALEEPGNLEPLVGEMIAELYKDPERNLIGLRELLKRSALNSSLNTNKRLQLETVLWTI